MASPWCIMPDAITYFLLVQLKGWTWRIGRVIWNGKKLYIARLFRTEFLIMASAFSSSYLLRLQVPLSKSDWITVFTWAAPILIVDELLKYVGRVLNGGKTSLRRIILK
jgi:hypothetical protein